MAQVDKVQDKSTVIVAECYTKIVFKLFSSINKKLDRLFLKNDYSFSSSYKIHLAQLAQFHG
jgi:hypothetical protein